MNDFKIQLEAAVLDDKLKESIQTQLNGISKLSIKISDIDTTDITNAVKKAVRDGFKNLPAPTFSAPAVQPSTSSGNSRRSSQASIAKQISRIQDSLNTKLFDAKIAELESDFRKLGMAAEDAQDKVAAVRTAYSRLKTEGSPDGIITAHKHLNNELAKTKSELRIAKSNATEYIDTFKQVKLANKIEAWLKKNTAATKDAKNAMSMYLNEVNDGKITPKQFAEISSGFEEINAQMRAQGKLGKNFFDSLQNGISKFKDLGIAAKAVQTVFSKIKSSVEELKNIDSILTEISKTSDITAKSLKQLGDDSFEKASEYGRKASDYLTSIQEMNRSGFYGEKGNAMAEQSLLAQSAGDMSEDIANKWILATNAAYKYEGEAKKINDVLDGANSITNRNSVNMTDMAEAISTVGTSASQAGVQINELSAIVGTAVATTKKDGNEVGTALKALFINLQNSSSDKIKSTLDKANASMTTMKNGIEELRSPIEILKDLSEAYNKLGDKDPLKSEITTNLGGKHHANILAALLSNYDQYNKMLEDYADGSGSAMEEAQKSANNWEGSLNRLSNTWTDIVNNFADSDGITTGINALNGLLSVVNDLTSALGSFGSIGAGLGAILSAKNVGRVKCNPSYRICLP